MQVIHRPPRPAVSNVAAAFILAVGIPAPVLAQAGDGLDTRYTQLIREYTTEPFFSTPYVDHLPASDLVPTPLDVLGHIAGAPDVLSYPQEVNAYMRAVADASPRVRVISLGESEEGREMIAVVVSAAATIADLDSYKERLRRLGDPRRTSPAAADSVIREAKPIYWATGAIHSPETGSPEMLMELVYRLAVDESPRIRIIRDSSIVMITPITEVDGRAKQVDVHMAKRRDPDAVVPSRILYWGKYVAHDNNRDGIGLSLNLSRHIVRTFLDFHPTVVHDLHESASHLYTSTGRGPYNAWVDPIVINEWNTLAYAEVKEMTALGVPGVYTHDFYDGWAPNYMMFVAHLHNSIGRFYETQGAGDASTRVLTTNVERQWHRPNTPLKETTWSIRNNVNLQQSALLIALHHVAANKTEFLDNFYRKSQRSVVKATAEGPAAYVFPADEPRPALQARLLRLLQQHGLEIHRTTRDATIDDRSFATGSYVIRMDQPFSRGADMLLDKQYYNPDDPRPYDDVGWTLGPLFNVETVRIEDPAVLEVEMTLVRDSIRAPGGVQSSRGRAVAYAIDYAAQNRLAEFRFAHPDLAIVAAEASFEAGDRTFRPGSFILSAADNPADLPARLQAAGARLEFAAWPLREVPDIAVHPLVVPRVAVIHTWTTTQSEGWLRIGLDEFGIPYDYVSVHEVRDEPDLAARYDVVVMGPSTSDALSLLRGVTGPKPIPWQRTALTPNLGRQDETADMRGGLELQGVLNLARFVEAGGTLITLTSSSSLPVHFGLAERFRIKDTAGLWARGGVFRATVADGQSPLAYGYDGELGVYFNTGPVFERAGGGFGRFRRSARGPQRDTPGNTTGRRTGRGGIGEEDVVQGRPRDLGRMGVEAFRAEEAEDDDPATPADPPDYRIVFRFASDPNDLLISGGLRNGEEMANAPALVDVTVGNGHVVMFSFNPFWRGETLGAYSLVLNAILHHGYLDAGRPVPDTEVVATPETGRERP